MTGKIFKMRLKRRFDCMKRIQHCIQRNYFQIVPQTLTMSHTMKMIKKNGQTMTSVIRSQWMKMAG